MFLNDEGISSELLIHGIHEPLTTHLVNEEIRSGMKIIDIGSNIGYYAILESRLVGKSGKIFSIEPSPTNFELLKENLELQNEKNFELYNLAIGDKNEEIEFLISKKSNWSKIKGKTDIVGENEVIKVSSKTLDEFCEQNKIENIDLIRMDVEGYEFNIINGAEKILKKFKPIIMIEIHKMYLGKVKTKKIFEELKRLDFELKYYYPRIFDTPIIAEKKDIKKLSIDELMEKLNQDKLPEAFQITAISK